MQYNWSSDICLMFLVFLSEFIKMAAHENTGKNDFATNTTVSNCTLN